MEQPSNTIELMSIMKEVHPVQASILRVLMFKPEARFSDLNTENISSDHFTFHVKKLLEMELIEKTDAGLYRLTRSGKEFTNRFDTDVKQIVLERQAKIGVSIVCTRERNGKTEYLIQQRLKQPYYGFYGFVTGKVRWGESVHETAARELKEETGFSATLKLAGIEHKMDYSEDGDLLEDKYFFIFKGTSASGGLIEQFEGGRNEWFSREEIRKLEDVFGDLEEVLDVIIEGAFAFIERKFTVSKY